MLPHPNRRTGSARAFGLCRRTGLSVFRSFLARKTGAARRPNVFCAASAPRHERRATFWERLGTSWEHLECRQDVEGSPVSQASHGSMVASRWKRWGQDCSMPAVSPLASRYGVVFEAVARFARKVVKVSCRLRVFQRVPIAISTILAVVARTVVHLQW